MAHLSSHSSIQFAPSSERFGMGIADAAVGGLVGESLGLEATPPLTDASLSPVSSRDSPPNQQPSLWRSPPLTQDGGSPALAGWQDLDVGPPSFVE